MRIEIEEVTDWKRVLNAARFTVKKEPLDHEPSKAFKKAIILAEHSPLRLLEFDIRVYDVPKYVIMHLVRHNQGIEKFVSTSRPDRNKEPIPRHEQRADDLIDCQFSVNAQALINISRVRLCNRAEKATRELWRSIVDKVRTIEPELACACMPNCLYRGFCPEMKPCGLVTDKEIEFARSCFLENFKKTK